VTGRDAGTGELVAMGAVYGRISSTIERDYGDVKKEFQNL